MKLTTFRNDGRYLNLDGETINVTNGTFDFTTTGTITSGDITIFDATPILIFKDSNSLGAASVGFIEWRDSGGGRAGFFGNNSSGNDDLYWKNEQGGNIGIETTGVGNLNIIATLAQFNATPITTTDLVTGYLRASAGTTTVAPLKVATGTALTTPEAGAIEFHNDRFYITDVAVRRSIDRSSDVIVATTTVANTVNETTIYTSVIGANALKVGNNIHVNVSGIISNATAADDITINCYVGTDLIESFNPAVGNITNADWHGELELTVRTVGGSGTIASHGHMEIDGNVDDTNELDTIDTTAAEDITVKVIWDNAKAGNTISIYQGSTHWTD